MGGGLHARPEHAGTGCFRAKRAARARRNRQGRPAPADRRGAKRRADCPHRAAERRGREPQPLPAVQRRQERADPEQQRRADPEPARRLDRRQSAARLRAGAHHRQRSRRHRCEPAERHDRSRRAQGRHRDRESERPALRRLQLPQYEPRHAHDRHALVRWTRRLESLRRRPRSVVDRTERPQRIEPRTARPDRARAGDRRRSLGAKPARAGRGEPGALCLARRRAVRDRAARQRCSAAIRDRPEGPRRHVRQPGVSARDRKGPGRQQHRPDRCPARQSRTLEQRRPDTEAHLLEAGHPARKRRQHRAHGPDSKPGRHRDPGQRRLHAARRRRQQRAGRDLERKPGQQRQHRPTQRRGRDDVEGHRSGQQHRHALQRRRSPSDRGAD